MAGKTAILAVKVLGDSKGLTSELGRAEKGVGGFAKSIAKVGGLVAGLGIGAGLLSSVKAAEEAAATSAKLANVLEQTAGASEAVTKAVEDQASALSMKIGVDDDTIKAGQTILGTFKSVAASAGQSGGMFERATAAAADLAAAGFGSIESQSTALGKALENPAKGLAALAKSGVTFTDQQKEQIRAMQESGDLLGAQTILMAAVEGQVQGTAEAGATASQKMSVAFGELAESVGGLLLPALSGLAGFVTGTVAPAIQGLIDFIGSGDMSGFAEALNISPDNAILRWFAQVRAFVVDTLIPAFKRFGDWIRNSAIPAVAAFAGWLQKYQGWLLPIAAAVGAVVVALQLYAGVMAVVRTATALWAAAQVALNVAMSLNPIGLIVLAIVALVAAIALAWNRSEAFRDAIKAVWEAVKSAISSAVGFIIGLFRKWWDFVKAYFQFLRDAFGRVFELVTSPFKAAIDFVIGLWEGLKGVISGIFDWMKGILNGIIDAINKAIRGANLINPFKDIPEIPNVRTAPPPAPPAPPAARAGGGAASAEAGGRTRPVQMIRVELDGRELRSLVREQVVDVLDRRDAMARLGLAV